MVKWRKYRNYILLKTILKCLNASIHIIIMQLANLTKKQLVAMIVLVNLNFLTEMQDCT